MEDVKFYSDELEKLKESTKVNNHEMDGILFMMSDISDLLRRASNQRNNVEASEMNKFNTEQQKLITSAIQVLEKCEQLKTNTKTQVTIINWYKDEYSEYRKSFKEQPTDSMTEKKNKKRPRSGVYSGGNLTNHSSSEGNQRNSTPKVPGEELAAINPAKCPKAMEELEKAEKRADNEAPIAARLRTRHRSISTVQHRSSSAQRSDSSFQIGLLPPQNSCRLPRRALPTQ